MANRYDRDADERNRGEFSGGPYGPNFGGDYARDGGFSGGGRRDAYTRDTYGLAREIEPAGRTSFRGRGPKNWRRSDERIREDVAERLTEHHDVDATDVDIEVKDGEVTLSGHVSTRLQKRLAEEIALHCSGVHDVHNRLTVKDRETHIGKASE
ncbi:MAG TPA: BON domain-containing protein [Thermoanaerobaculia bacterium]